MEEVPYVGGPLHGQMARRLPSDTRAGRGWWSAYRDDTGDYLEVMDPEQEPETGYRLVANVTAEDQSVTQDRICYLHMSDTDLTFDQHIEWWESRDR